MKTFAEKFYKSKQWKRTRELYARSVGGLCEICWNNGIIRPGEIVHHKIHLDESNIDNPLITMDWSNLELVCRDCHAALHKDEGRRRYRIEKDGSVIIQKSER